MPRAILRDARIAAAFLLGLPGFLRRPIDAGTARAVVRARLARRADDFLALTRRFVYNSAGSPYRRLLQHAGCEYGDLERLVRADGVEGALATLVQHGVVLTVDEFKGRRAAVRGSASVTVTPESLVNPAVNSRFVAHSSGSRGPATPVPLDLAFVGEHAVNRRLSLDAQGALAWRHAVWGGSGGSEMAIVLRFAVCGARLDRWFTPLDARNPRLPFAHRWNARVMRWGSLLAGMPLPVPQPVDLLPIARWMQHTLEVGATPHLKTYASMAVRLCGVAAEAGIHMAGARFTVTGEPLTPARLSSIVNHGAQAVPDYGSTEAGQVGEPCTRPDAADDVHVMDDLHGVIQPGPAGQAYGLPGRALLVTSLRPTAPLVLLNVSMGDEARMATRSCGCPLEAHGWRRHLHTIRSFEKLTSGGVTFLDAEVIRVLEELLPSRFGGSPAHYQLVEDETAAGEPRLSLLVDPSVGTVDQAAVIDAFRQAVGDPRVWQQTAFLRVVRQAPRTTASSKILHLHRESLDTPSMRP